MAGLSRFNWPFSIPPSIKYPQNSFIPPFAAGVPRFDQVDEIDIFIGAVVVGEKNGDINTFEHRDVVCALAGSDRHHFILCVLSKYLRTQLHSAALVLPNPESSGKTAPQR